MNSEPPRAAVSNAHVAEIVTPMKSRRVYRRVGSGNRIGGLPWHHQVPLVSRRLGGRTRVPLHRPCTSGGLRLAVVGEKRPPPPNELAISLTDRPDPTIQVEQTNRVRFVLLDAKAMLPVDLVRERV